MNLPYCRKSAIITGICFLLILLPACGRNREAKYSQLLKKYDEYFAAGKLEEARLSIQSAVDIKPKESDAYYKLAEVLLRQQKFPAAVENYRSAINYNGKNRDARYRLASILLAAKDYESAEDNAVKILEVNPKDTDALILKANILAASTRKDFVKAREILGGVLKENPKHVNAIASLGMIALQQEELKEAEDHFLDAESIDPKNMAIRLVLADMYAKQGRLDESQRQLESVLQDDPGNANVRFGFAEFLLKRGLGGQAEEQYAASLKSDPLRHDARDRLYDIYLARREVDKARALTAELEKAAAENPGTDYFRGRDLELDGKLPKALEKYLSSIKAQTTFAPAFRRAGFIQLAMGEEQAGLENLNKAIAVDPGDVPSRLELASRALNSQKLAEASEQVKQVLMRFPQHLSAHVIRADIAMADGHYDDARKVYQFLIEKFPKSPAGYTKLAMLEEKDNHPDKAIELYRKALAFDVNVLTSGQRFARLLLAKGGVASAREQIEKLEQGSKNSKPEYDFLLAGLAMADPADSNRVAKSREYLAKAVEQRPGMSAAYFALASLDAAQGNKDAAAANYEKVAAANPHHIPSRVLLASIREQQGRVDDAIKLYREILGIDPKIGIAANNLAWLLAEKGADLDEALKYGTLAKERMPDVGDAADTLGWIHFKRGSSRAALPFIQEALVLNEKNDMKQSNPVVEYHLAEVQLSLGDKAAARAAAEKALAGIPEKHPTRARLQEIIQLAGK